MYTLNPQKQQKKQICRFLYVKPWKNFKKIWLIFKYFKDYCCVVHVVRQNDNLLQKWGFKSFVDFFFSKT